MKRIMVTVYRVESREMVSEGGSEGVSEWYGIFHVLPNSKVVAKFECTFPSYMTHKVVRTFFFLLFIIQITIIFSEHGRHLIDLLASRAITTTSLTTCTGAGNECERDTKSKK